MTTNAIVLTIKPSGENNSSVCFFSETEGIIWGTMYGGPKSKLKSLVSPWNTGKAYFTETNKGHTLKISDFEPVKYHLSFRTDLYKNLAASLAAELIIKTKCAASLEKSWFLLNGFLDGLDLCTNKKQESSGLFRFLWRYLNAMGILPDSQFCSHCSESLFTGVFENSDVKYRRKHNYFVPYEGTFVCSSCYEQNYGQNQNAFPASEETCKYLNGILTLSPSESRKMELKQESEQEIKGLLFWLVENVSGTKLKSLETGKGIL